jgi:hypothetical protein
MHYATSRKVAGSIPNEVIGFFNWPNPSSRTMTLGSTQPLTEMSARNLSGGKGRAARGADNLTAICEPIVYKMWEPRRLTTLWAFTACYRDSFTILYLFTMNISCLAGRIDYCSDGNSVSRHKGIMLATRVQCRHKLSVWPVCSGILNVSLSVSPPRLLMCEAVRLLQWH